jgi:hypothetical protein
MAFVGRGDRPAPLTLPQAMYWTCLYCLRDFGANAVLETLPIGRRVAFDHDNGRLWVVCRGCEKWNLVPFDTRLETVDSCERLFRDARRKYSTDHIGIARLPEGLELVRIGPAEQHEFAAWRYGDQFGRRRRKGILVSAGMVAGLGATVAARFVVGHGAIPLVGISGVAGAQILQYSYQGATTLYHRRRIVAHVEDGDGNLIGMTPTQVDASRLLVYFHREELKLELAVYQRTRDGFATSWNEQHVTLEGDQVLPALGKLLPRVNRGDGADTQVQSAVNLLQSGRSAALLARMPRATGADTAVRRLARLRIGRSTIIRLAPGAPAPYSLVAMPPTARLALEMMAHEESERAALAGELKLLERQWRDADKLAKIADELELSDEVSEAVDGTV